VSKFCEQFILSAIFVGCEHFFADVSSKIIALADPVLSQPDMEREMVSPRTGAYIPSFTIYHVLPDLAELESLQQKYKRRTTGTHMLCTIYVSRT
jgi:hypothetical protein